MLFRSKGKILPADKSIWLNNAKANYDETKTILDAKAEGSALPKKFNVNNAGSLDLNNPAEIAKAARKYMKDQKEDGTDISYAQAVNAVMQ